MHRLFILTALLLAPPVTLYTAEAPAASGDLGLQAARVIVSPALDQIAPTKRQGVAGVERTSKGRLWTVYGRNVESTRNYQVVRFSDDDGRMWSEVKLMILPNEGTRAMSANVWIDPQQRLWLFWGQSAGMQDGRFGVWAMTTDEPDANDPKWSVPRRIGDGIMMNKPTVLANGDWLLTSTSGRPMARFSWPPSLRTMCAPDVTSAARFGFELKWRSLPANNEPGVETESPL